MRTLLSKQGRCSAAKEGGGIWANANGSDCLVTNTLFKGNRAGESGNDAQNCTVEAGP
ncbi:hypothetical protein PDESU_00646 [Pontiella desulfatans]|uniref:Uncharacterized protein n=1 Tax=Pontiella desulfatans TaxID=2750659 RepID=A0A6C2TXU5_PONDE|nr:hypothetical protein PDESU_00646 [Pontiella desulfatans]